MSQIKILNQVTQSQTGITGATNMTPVPLGGALSISTQAVISNVATGISGASAVLQISNDAEDVTPSNWTDWGSSQNITTAANLYFVGPNGGLMPPGNWVRLKIAISAGSFDIANTFVVKGPN